MNFAWPYNTYITYVDKWVYRHAVETSHHENIATTYLITPDSK